MSPCSPSLPEPEPLAHRHQAYGLAIHSSLPLPELLADDLGFDAEADCVIRERTLEPATEEVAPGVRRWVASDEACFTYEGIATFHMRAGRELLVDPVPGVADERLRMILLGPMLSVLLHQRGLLVLHASALAIDGMAVAFLGQSGAGKSTTAAALHARGHRLIGDDVLAVRLDGTAGPTVTPAFPQFKLWPDAATALGHAVEDLAPICAGESKRILRTDSTGRPVCLPLGRLYVLADADRLTLEPLAARDGLVELIRHTFVASLVAETGAASHFRQCAQLASAVPIRRLGRPRALGDLARMAEAIEADARAPVGGPVTAATEAPLAEALP